MEQKLAKKSFSLVKIEFDSVRHELGYDPTTEEREAYYTNHKEGYRVAEKRDLSYWVLSPSVAEKRVDVPEEVVEKFYKKNKSSLYRVPPSVKVRHIFIKEGENAHQLAYELHGKISESPSSFSDLATKHSDDGETAKKGGLRDFFSRGTYDKAFENAALRLKKPEDLSPVVKSETGYEIIQLVERIPAREKDLSEVRQEVERAVRGKRALEWLRAHLERIRKDADGNKELVREVTGETSRQIRNNVDQAQANTYSIEGLVVQNGFTLRGEGSYSFFMHDDNYVLIQLSKKTGSFIPALKQVQKDVENDIIAQKTREKMDEIAKKVRISLVSGQEASAVADELNARFMKTDSILVTQASHSAFHGNDTMLRKAFMLNSTGQALRHDVDKDVYLVQLRSIDDASAQEAAVAMNDIEHINSTLSEQATAVSRAFIANLRRSAKIEINEKMLTVRPGQVA
jgi:parvulin-like peptidyl-prolyl isomerase